MLGYAPDEIVGTEAKRLFRNGTTEELDEMMRQIGSGSSNSEGGTVSKKAERMRKDSSPISVISTASAILDDDGKVVGYVEVLRDMSSLVRLDERERELKRQQGTNREIEAQVKDMRAFISDISHELRTPLTNIHGYASLLKDGEAGKMEGQQSEYMGIIYKETERMNKLISDVLDLSKMEEEKFKFSPRLFDPRTLVERCSCRALAEKKGLYVRWAFDDEVQEIYGDLGHVARILMNLISNAIKFTSAGGVTVRVSAKSRTFAQFEVSDTGIGIAPEDRSKLFRRFSQLGAGGTKKEAGTGLGLAITRQLVQMHGGKIGVDSDVGKGTTFTFTLRRTSPSRSKKE
jgi:PAS domain S-box-containing protein